MHALIGSLLGLCAAPLTLAPCCWVARSLCPLLLGRAIPLSPSLSAVGLRAAPLHSAPLPPLALTLHRFTTGFARCPPHPSPPHPGWDSIAYPSPVVRTAWAEGRVCASWKRMVGKRWCILLCLQPVCDEGKRWVGREGCRQDVGKWLGVVNKIHVQINILLRHSRTCLTRLHPLSTTGVHPTSPTLARHRTHPRLPLPFSPPPCVSWLASRLNQGDAQPR